METDLDSVLGLVSEADYAAFVGKTIDSVRNERSAGRGPRFIKHGKMIKYRVADIRSFVDAHTVEPSNAGTFASPSQRSTRRGARASGSAA